MGWKTKTNTILIRTKFIPIRKLKKYGYLCDSILIYELRKKGPFLYFNQCTAVYRLHSDGIWSMKTEEEKKIIRNRINKEIRRANYLEEVIVKTIKKHFGFINNL